MSDLSQVPPGLKREVGLLPSSWSRLAPSSDRAGGPVALRKSDPDRERPDKMAGLNIIAPFGFVVSGLIIYRGQRAGGGRGRLPGGHHLGIGEPA